MSLALKVVPIELIRKTAIPGYEQAAPDGARSAKTSLFYKQVAPKGAHSAEIKEATMLAPPMVRNEQCGSAPEERPVWDTEKL